MLSDALRDMGLYKRAVELMPSEKRCLVIFKGFGTNEMYNCESKQLFRFNREDINNDKCDIKPDLLNVLDMLKTGENYYVMYEDYALCADTIVSLLELNGYSISVIDNNLFSQYYPLAPGFNSFKLAKLVDDYKNGQLTEIFDDYISIENEMMVSYQVCKGISEKNTIQLFQFKGDTVQEIEDTGLDEVISLGSTAETYAQGLLHILRQQNKKVLIKNENNAFTPFHDELIEILSSLGFSVYKAKTPVESFAEKDYSRFEEILKRKNQSYSFKSIDFYVDPGYSLQTTSVSQGEIIDAIVENAIKASKDESYNDIFVTAPTGSGKSVLFQIPAIYLAEKYNFLTVVVSPLIGLMNDQTKNIKALTDKAATINSEYTPEEKDKIKEQIRNNEISILYVSPETLLSNNPISLLIGETRKIGLLAVDEAHIVSTWGKSFRPDYWFLGDYIAKMRNKDGMKFPIATFSATVTYGGDDDMHGDILDSLHMKTGRYEYIAPMRRDDISFDIRVLEKKNDYQKEKDVTVITALKNLIENNKKTIAYFPFTKLVNNYSKTLGHEKACRYYGGLNSIEKNKSAEDFKLGKVNLMLATKAFGMGIDIDDIEVIYHYAPTGNLSDYVQEIGRVARKPGMRGVAKTDFYKDYDFKYINQLYGMSSIKCTAWD